MQRFGSAYKRGLARPGKIPALNSISGLLFWYDAADISTITISSGVSVSQWADKSGNGFHATQGTAARQPYTNTNTIAGKNVINFSNANQTYLLSSGSMQPNTMAMVWRSAVTPWPDYYGVITARTSSATLTSNGAWNSGMQGVAATANICGLGETSVGAWVNGNAVNAANFDTYLSGVSSAPITNTNLFVYTDDVLSAGAMYWGIGVDVYSIARCLNGDIAEIACWNRALAQYELDIVTLNLRTKWGI